MEKDEEFDEEEENKKKDCSLVTGGENGGVNNEIGKGKEMGGEHGKKGTEDEVNKKRPLESSLIEEKNKKSKGKMDGIGIKERGEVRGESKGGGGKGEGGGKVLPEKGMEVWIEENGRKSFWGVQSKKDNNVGEVALTVKGW